MKSIRPAYWCLVSTTLLVTLVFVVAVLLSIIPYRCLWLEEYYWITDGSYVALYPILVFTYLLLGWWSLFIPASHNWSGDRPSRAEYATVIANSILLAVVAVNLWALWDWVAFDNYRKYGTLPREPQYSKHFWHVSLGGFFQQSECFSDVEVEGVWHVDDAIEPSVAAETVIFWRNRTYEVSNADGDLIEGGTWYGEPWTERIVLQSDLAWQVWERQHSPSATSPRLVLNLFLFEPLSPYDRSARPLAKRFDLERVDRPYNSAPQQVGPRIISPATMSIDVGDQKWPLHPEAQFE